MTSRAAILNAFTPNAPIESPAAFAGRADLVRGLADSLQTVGSCPIIYGDRGLGKSSLAFQMARIALGDVELLDDLGASDLALPDDSRFTPFYIACSDSVASKDDILQRIINSAEGYEDLRALAPAPLVAETKTTRLKFRLFERETEKRFEREVGERYADLNIEDRLLAVIDTLHSKGHPRIVLIIDELDRVASTAGLASVIKNCSSASLKFILVGVANSVSTLLADHESIQRTLYPVKVPRMRARELQQIIEKTELLLDEAGITISFDEEASNLLVSAANGFPWFVHLLGQDALVDA